ncbi:MAG: hypothetical protein QM479_16225 [Pseudomonadota bacterium]
MNDSAQSSISDNSVELNDSKIVKIVTWIGIATIIIGLLICVFTSKYQPILFISGIIAVAIGIFTVVIAKFSTWWNFG